MLSHTFISVPRLTGIFACLTCVWEWACTYIHAHNNCSCSLKKPHLHWSMEMGISLRGQWDFHVDDTISGTHIYIPQTSLQHTLSPFPIIPPPVSRSPLIPPFPFQQLFVLAFWFFFIVDNVIESINFPLTSTSRRLSLRNAICFNTDPVWHACRHLPYASFSYIVVSQRECLTFPRECRTNMWMGCKQSKQQCSLPNIATYKTYYWDNMPRFFFVITIAGLKVRLRLVDWLISSYRRARFEKGLRRMLCTRLPNSQRLLTSPSIKGESSRDTKNLLLPLEAWQSLMPLSPSLFGPASLCYNNEIFCPPLLLWSEQLNSL